jgi:hypothetical protein
LSAQWETARNLLSKPLSQFCWILFVITIYLCYKWIIDSICIIIKIPAEHCGTFIFVEKPIKKFIYDLLFQLEMCWCGSRETIWWIQLKGSVLSYSSFKLRLCFNEEDENQLIFEFVLIFFTIDELFPLLYIQCRSSDASAYRKLKTFWK